MTGSEAIRALIQKIFEKTVEGKVQWRTEGDICSADPTPTLRAVLVLHVNTPFDASWQRFVLIESGEEVADIANPAIYHNLGVSKQQEDAIGILEKLFDRVVLQPRRARVENTLKALDSL